jgi:hypothetical protein
VCHPQKSKILDFYGDIRRNTKSYISMASPGSLDSERQRDGRQLLDGVQPKLQETETFHEGVNVMKVIFGDFRQRNGDSLI